MINNMMVVKLCIILLSVWCVSEANTLKRLRVRRSVSNPMFQDCGGRNKIINFIGLSVTPNPIIIPGKLSISLHAENTQPMPNMDIHANLMSEGWLSNVSIPCIADFGSCKYNDVCSLMVEHRSKAKADDALPILKKLVNSLDAVGAPKECPIPATTLWIPNLEIDINESLIPPLVRSFLSFVDGVYYAQYKILEHGNHDNELGCLIMKATVSTVVETEEDKCKWFCW